MKTDYIPELIDRKMLQMGATRIIIDGVEFYPARDIDCAAIVDPVVHAKWIHNDEWWEFICTHCHKAIGNIKRYQYCPHCGAKMDLEEQK